MRGVDLAMNHSNVKPTTKKRAKAVLSVFLVVAILIAGAYAFLSATDSKTNVFTVGNVDIELHEIFNGRDYGKGEDPGAIGDKIENIVPGQSIEKAPYVVNTGKNPAYTFIAVGIPTDTSDNVYNGQGTYTAKSELDIKVKAYAIQQQYNGATDAESTWMNYFKNDMISGTASDAGIELFTLNDGTSAVTTGTHTIGSDWQEFSTPYSVTDGGNTYTYHFFKYVANNELLPVGTTTAHLFDKVVFNENLGNVKEPLLTLDSGDVIPDNVSYIPKEGEELTSGDTVPAILKTGDIVRDGDYEYCYNSGGYEVQMNEWWNFNDSLNCWGTRLINKNMTSVTQMLVEIQGKPVNVSNCFEWNNKIDTLDSSIIFPQNVISKQCFYQCVNLKNVSINKNVTSIGEAAFQNCSLKSVIIPNGVTNIGSCAFSGCTGLTNITIPDSIKDIGGGAFSGTSLTNIAIPDTVANIGPGAFSGCSGLTHITIPRSMTKIDGSFSGCTGLTRIVIPDNITNIGNDAFANCTKLTNVTIPNSVTSIGSSAFSGCPEMTSITIPDSVTNIGHGAFQGCTKLTNITIPSSITSIDGSFACSELTNIIIPDNVTSIGYQAFRECHALANITISDSVTSIGEEAFYECSSLKNIEIPNSITKIEKGAFANAGLTNVTIPDSVTSIGEYAFSGCFDLTNITISQATYNTIIANNSSAFSGFNGTFNFI